MSNKIQELLEVKLEDLKEQEKQYDKLYFELREKIRSKYQEILEGKFEDILQCIPDLKLTCNDDSITIKRKGSYKELVRLYLSRKDYSKKVIDRLDTSFYSTNENSKEELERMVLIGKMGEKLLKGKEFLFKIYNDWRNEDDERIKKLKEKIDIYSIHTSITNIKNQINIVKSNKKWEDFLKEGLDFSDREYHKLPSFDLKLSEGEFRINKLEFKEYSKTGTTCTVKLYFPNQEGYIKEMDRINVEKLKEWIKYY